MATTNKQLREKIKELEDIVGALLNGWKAKHPKDFELPENIKLMKLSS